jgi:hypothetical protein
MTTLRGITIPRPDPFTGLALACSIIVMLFILLPLMEMILQPSTGDMADALKDSDVLNAIGLSIGTALCAGLIALVLGTPFAYLRAHRDFPGKKLAVKTGFESIPRRLETFDFAKLRARYPALAGGEHHKIIISRKDKNVLITIDDKTISPLDVL